MFFRKPSRIEPSNESEPAGTLSLSELEDLLADVRGLKRLAQLTDDATKAQNERFALALDTLEARINDLNGLVVALGATINANREELSRRIDRVAALAGELQLREGVKDEIFGFKVADEICGFKVASEQNHEEAHEARKRAEAAIAQIVQGGAGHEQTASEVVAAESQPHGVGGGAGVVAEVE